MTQKYDMEFKLNAVQFGSPKITQILRQEGERIEQKTVAKIMRENELRSRTVRKYKATTYSNHDYPVHDNVLNQKFVAERPNQVYMADITYVPTAEGWLYVASLMDLYSRKFVGWRAGSRMTKELVIGALEHVMTVSMSRKGNCFDNACIESFHSVFKRERVYLEKFETRAQAKKRIFEYIEVWYNRERIHSSTAYMSPVEYERGYFRAMKTKAS